MLKKTVTVTVLKSFDYQGKGYTAGQAIALHPTDAVVLSRKRFVTLSKRKAKALPPEPVAEVAPEPPQEAPRARRSYKRRDMQAEERTALEPEPAVPEPVSEQSRREPYAEDF